MAKFNPLAHQKSTGLTIRNLGTMKGMAAKAKTAAGHNAKNGTKLMAGASGTAKCAPGADCMMPKCPTGNC